MRDVVKRTKLTENCSKETIKKYVDEVIKELTLDEKIGIPGSPTALSPPTPFACC